jgi:hypothetical protein
MVVTMRRRRAAATMMKRLLPLALLLGVTSCVMYLDNPARCVLRGRVTRANGQPVTNATVRVTAHRRHMTLFSEAPANVAGVATTDSNGCFVVNGKINFPASIDVNAPPLSARLELTEATTNTVLLQAKPGGGSLKRHLR